MDYSQAYRLADAIRAGEEYQTYHALKESVMADETQAALIREYRRLQTVIQMSAMSGQNPPEEDMQRFSALNALLYSKQEVMNYLLAEMRLQQALADIFKIVTDAADVEITLPGTEG